MYSFGIFPLYSFNSEQQEDEFVVYEPYCANYTSASELMLANEQNLTVSALVPRMALRFGIPFLSSPASAHTCLVTQATPFFRLLPILTKHLSTGLEPFDQCQRRATGIPNQAYSKGLQISPAP